MSLLASVDPEIKALIDEEIERQTRVLELIASENFASLAVCEAAASALTNKYAEGYPGKRYYGGCHVVDKVEELARNRAKELFGAEHVNVQPHSGSQANQAVYFSLLKPYDTVLGMNLAHGGHLTHGSPVNLSGTYYRFAHYGVNCSTETIDYDEVLAIAKQTRPALIVAGGSAYPRVIDFARFRQIADEVGAKLMVDMAHIAGLVAAAMHPSPVPHAHYVTSTTHKTLRGPRGGFILTNAELGPSIDKAVFPGIQGGPLMHIIAAKAVAFGEALRPSFKSYIKRVVDNAAELAKTLKDGGLRLISGGTDDHLLLVDLTPAGITGKEAENVLEQVGITVNKNAIPFDSRGPNVTSGIRLGTPALTSRGMGPEEMRLIGRIIVEAIAHRHQANVLEPLKKRTEELARNFPWPQAAER